MAKVYLLCFHKPLGNPQTHTAKHYLGYTSSGIQRRLEEHKNGNGAAITRALVELNIGFDLVRTWNGNRALERLLKAHHNPSLFCPRCNPRAMRRGVRPGSRKAKDTK